MFGRFKKLSDRLQAHKKHIKALRADLGRLTDRVEELEQFRTSVKELVNDAEVLLSAAENERLKARRAEERARNHRKAVEGADRVDGEEGGDGADGMRVQDPSQVDAFEADEAQHDPGDDLRALVMAANFPGLQA